LTKIIKCLGNAVSSNQTSSENIRVLKRENNLFLRAALQLLEENESFRGRNSGNQNNSALDLDIIRFGRLRKAARGGASSFSAIAPLWKWKYVELRHGSYTYEGSLCLESLSFSHTHPLAFSDDISSLNVPFLRNKASNNSKKVINLSVMAVSCRPFKIRTSQGNHLHVNIH